MSPSSAIAIIPARGGSKRIPRKNIKDFCGKPMITWSIQKALESELFDRVIVSTDDSEIAQVAVDHGAEVPFLRPPDLSNDLAGTRIVIQHAISELEQRSQFYPWVCCIYATAPFMTSADLRTGFEILQQTAAEFAYSVAKYPYPIQRALRITPEQRIEMLDPSAMQKRSQDMEETYHDAAQFYWGKATAFMNPTLRMPSAASAPVVIPLSRVQDIDTLDDWERAELMFQAMQRRISDQR